MEWMLLPFKRYAEFSGRSRRMEFWMWVLFQVIIYVVLFVILFTTIGISGFAQRGVSPAMPVAMMSSFGLFGVLLGLFWLATLIPNIAVQVRRLHDQDRSGWWTALWWGPIILGFVMMPLMLSSAFTANGISPTFVAVNAVLSIIRLVGWIILIVLYCLPGTQGPNRYGPDPLDPAGNLEDVFR